MNQTKLTSASPKITDGIRPALTAAGKWGIAMERSRGSTLLIWLPLGADTSQLSQLPALGILPIVSAPTLGSAAVSDNLFFPVLIWTKLGRVDVKGCALCLPSSLLPLLMASSLCCWKLRIQFNFAWFAFSEYSAKTTSPDLYYRVEGLDP